MFSKHRRQFLSLGAAAAAGGVLGYGVGRPFEVWAAEQRPPFDPPSGAPPQAGPSAFPESIVNPSEITGAEAIPVLGTLPNARRMYLLPAGEGEKHLVGSQIMIRVTRPAETGNVFEMSTFAGRSGAHMPAHAHLSSHSTILVMSGDVELELDGKRWRMMRGDFANIPPGIAHRWTMRSDKSQVALFSMGDRVGAAFMAMGKPYAGPELPALAGDGGILADSLAAAADAGDFQRAKPAPAGEAVRVTNKQLPTTAGPYVLADGGGEHYGDNSFLARNANTGGQFLFLVTEGAPGFGVGAHFHARHFENFYGMDGTTMGWANGKAVPIKTGDYFQAPPRNLHGFKLTEKYNRFAAFLTPGIFENFFVQGPMAGGPPPSFPGGPPVGAGAAPTFAGGPPNSMPTEGLQAVRPGAVPTPGVGGAPGPNGFAGTIPPEVFRMLMMSSRGPDGYPLDVHGAVHPLPPQDSFWTQGNSQHVSSMDERKAMFMHGMMMCGMMADMPGMSREKSPQLRAALKYKPKPESFV